MTVRIKGIRESDGSTVEVESDKLGGGGAILSKTVTLTSEQIKNTRASSPELIAAPGVGFAIQVLRESVAVFHAGETPYVTDSNDMDIIYAGEEGLENNRWGYVAPATGASAVSVIDSLNKTASGFGGDPTSTAVTVAENKAIVAHAENAEWADGDGTLTFHLLYRIIATA